MYGELYITGLCPHCSLKLDYLPEEKAVACTGCGAVLPTSALLLISKEQDASDAVEDKSREIFESITSTESALIHFDTFISKYDWATYAESYALEIPALNAIADAALMKFPADPLSYILDFKRRALPMLKKIDSLDVLLVELADIARGGDSSEIHQVFDLYSSITKSICQAREGIRAELVNDIVSAEKFGANEEQIEDLARGLELFDSLAGAVTPVTSLNEISEYKKIKLSKDAEHIAAVRARGIDPEKTYDKAMMLMANGDINNALRLLIAIAPYSDSEEIIERHTSVYRFGNGLYEMAGRIYLRRPEAVRGKGGRMNSTGCYALYEVIDGEPCDEPAISGVTDILATFGTRIFFIRKGRAVCCFDAANPELYANVRILDEANGNGYGLDGKHKIIMAKDRSCFYIKKKLNALEKGGFFRRKPTFNRDNNYALIKISMDTVDSRIALPLIVDVMDYFDDSIFYTTIPEGAYQGIFRMYNVKSGESKTLLGPDCVINEVYNGKIIYTVWSPNQYNMNLFTLDFVTNERTLIAKNVRRYHALLKGRIFYSIGGESHNRLYSIEMDGSDRIEIMSDTGRVLFVRAGWIYYKSGEGRNACLKKISLDGSEKMVIADRFDRILKMENGIIYYAGRGDALCAARCDGGGVTPIAKEVYTDEVVIDENCIYYLKQDMVLDGQAVYSLYSADLDGKNLNKIVYDVSALKEHNEDELYICKIEDKEFIIATPVSKKETHTAFVTATVRDFCRVDKKTGAISLIASVGAPEISYVPVEGRFLFFKKTKYLPTTITPIAKMAARYERSGVAAEGDILREAEAIVAKRKSDKKNRKNEKKQAKQAEKQAKKQAKQEKKK